MVQRPRQFRRYTTIKIGMQLPEGFTYGNIFKIFHNLNFSSRKLRFFANSDLEKLGYPTKSLVQRPGQTQRPTTIKIGMHLPEGLSYGHIFEHFENSNFFSRKLRFFCDFGHRIITGTQQKVWYNAQAKPNGLQR